MPNVSVKATLTGTMKTDTYATHGGAAQVNFFQGQCWDQEKGLGISNK